VKKGDLVWTNTDQAMYERPVGITDQAAAIRHYVGWVPEGTSGVILSDEEDWLDEGLEEPSRPWTRLLMEGRAVWFQTHFLSSEPVGPDAPDVE